MAVRIIFLMSVLSIPGMSQRWIGRVGLTYSRIFYDMEQNYGIPGVGIQLGKEIPLKNNWYFQPDIGLTAKGSIFNSGYLSSKETLMLLYADITLPLKVFPTEKRKGYFVFGPQISSGLTGRLFRNKELSRAGSWVKFQKPDQYTSDYEYYAYVDHRLDFGFQIGGGFVLDRFMIDISYCQGLRKIYDNELRSQHFGGDSSRTTAVNGVLQISLAKPLNWGKSTKD